MVYKGVMLDCGYRIDVVVEENLVLELKAVEHLLPVHEGQVLTYLKLAGLDVGLLVNFNTAALRHGIRHLVRPGADHVRLGQFRTMNEEHAGPGRPGSMQSEAPSSGPVRLSD